MYVCVFVDRTRPSLNVFCPWNFKEERGSYLDTVDVPFQLLDVKCTAVNMHVEVQGRVTFIANVGRVALIFRTNRMIECNAKC